MFRKTQLANTIRQVVLKRSNSTSTTSDISSQLSNIPKSTGAGPFIEYPKFEPLGNPASLINITLPPSSVLNIRTNSILAANGDLNNITSKLSILKLFPKLLVYNKISSTTPLSLILSNKGSTKFFINLELSEFENWTIFNTKNLIAWYGPELDISNNKIGVNLSSGNNKSNILLNGETQLFTLNLENDEKLYLNPKSIIAINSNTSAQNFQKLDTSQLQLAIPKFKFWDSIKISFNSLYSRLEKAIKSNEQNEQNEIKTISTDTSKESTKFEIPQFFKNFKTWVLTKLNNFNLNDNKIFYEVKGPATIVIQNSTSISTSKLFSNEQLIEIYKQMKKHNKI